MSQAAESMQDWPPEPDISHIVIDDGEPVDNLISERQMGLLVEPLYASYSGPPPREDGLTRPFFAGSNIGLFSSIRTLPLVPDAFLSVDVATPAGSNDKRKQTYFFWEFGKPPDLVVEVVSNDRGGELSSKVAGYARMRISYYVVFDPYGDLIPSPGVRSFELHQGEYVPTAAPYFPSLGLRLVKWHGTYEGVESDWLRFASLDGSLLLTGSERAANAEEQARAAEEQARAAEEQARTAEEQARTAEEQARTAEEQARAAEEQARAAEQRAEVDRSEVARLREKLRALGVDPDGALVAAGDSGE
ncbi:MAG: Uma2 family endonuclease [Deltaproteobacteria bacterium]|nr:Uma2 family endonuclease [Deltaproteobacteria bacterium]